ncbi:MAG: tetratricopeptide repeat protein [Spirochaetes bacterium]|nr:tetratricopeptide repeat protein [Spirochaetota bacterium]
MKKILIIMIMFSGINIYAQSAAEPELTPQEEARQLERFSDDVRFDNAKRFVELKFYDKALQYLGEYIEVFQNGAHRVEAITYIAEIYFQRFEYMKSLQYYNLLYEENNNNDIGLNAYYNMGLCYSKMGYTAKANEIYNILISEHPASEIALKARLQVDVDSIIN